MTELGGSAQDGGGQRARQGRRTRHILAWVAVALTVVLVGGVLTAYVAYENVFGRIHQVKVTGLGNRPPGYNSSLNILVIGSDTRSGANRKFGRHVTGQRSDTILVLHISPGYHRAVVMSIPRDSVVPVVACPAADGTGGQSAQPGQVEQINATYADGGPGCLWKTIEQTTHIRLDHFMALNFTGFERVINDLGGVSVCLPYAINDPQSRLHLSRGLHHVMGAEALAYWRVRYIGEGSDLERITRDQYLMASLAQSVRHSHLLGSPSRLYQVVRDTAASLTTDTQLTQTMLISLAEGLKSMPLHDLHFVQVPVQTYAPNPNWVQWSPEASVLFHAIAHDRKLPRMAGKGRHHHQRRLAQGQPSGTAPASPSASPSSRSGDAPTNASPLSKNYGGISAGANVCRDTGAFAGPLGGH